MRVKTVQGFRNPLNKGQARCTKLYKNLLPLTWLNITRIIMEWISVNDRLPDVAQNVLVIRFSNGVFFLPDIAHYYGGEFFPDHELPDDVDFNSDWITHWMPLPEPPINH